MSALLNVKQFVRFDEHGNLHVPNKLFVACQAYVQTPFLNDTSSRVATTEWVRAQIVGLTNVPLSETDPIWIFEKALYYTKVQADARYLQSFTETDPTVPAWAKASVKPSYAYSELTGLPTLFSGAYADLTGKPTLFSGSYTDLTNKPTIPTYTLSGLGGQPLDADLTAIAALSGTAGFLKKTAADTWALDNNTYLTSYTETDPIWTAEKTNYALKTYVDTSISNLVASAPAALNTLNELALALGSDANFSTTVATSIGNKVPYTGANANVDLGIYTLTASSLRIYENSGSSGSLILNTGTTGYNYGINAISLVSSPTVANTLLISSDVSSVRKIAQIGLGSLTATRTFTLPDLSGTIALTSNLSAYVPYTGATGAVNLGDNTLNAGNININPSTGEAQLNLKNTSTGNTIYNGMSSIFGVGGGALGFGLSIGSSTYKSFTFNFAPLTNNTTRIFTFQDASGTIALTSDIPSLTNYVTLATDQTITGSKTFSNPAFAQKGVVLGTGSTSFTAGQTTLNGNANGLTIALGVTVGQTTTSYAHQLLFPQLTPRTYTYPAASGTVALTSDFASYVPYSGATADINIGNFSIYSNYLNLKNALYLNGDTYNGAIVMTSNKGGQIYATTNSINITPAGIYLLDFTFGGAAGGAANLKNFRLDVASLNVNELRTYVMPNASGTLALTSNLSSYVPTTRTITINGTALNLSEDRAWTITAGTTYSAFTGATASANGTAGLVIAPLIANRGQYLRGDGTWATPPDTDTDTNTVTQIRRENADGTTSATAYRTGDIRLRQGTNVTISEVAAGVFQISSSYVDTDTNTWDANTKTVAGYVSAPGDVANKVWKTDGTGNPGWRDDADTDTNTWNANSKTVAGYVSAPGDIANKVWKTDATGNPGWRDDADTDTNTTYTASTGLTLTGTAFSITDTITTAATANTIAKRDGSAVISAGGFYQTSSKTLKTSIIDYNESALDIINKINVVSFYYKADVKNKRIGFIAEDSPEEVATIDHNVMDTNSTVGLLLKAIQQLEARIKVLENV